MTYPRFSRIGQGTEFKEEKIIIRPMPTFQLPLCEIRAKSLRKPLISMAQAESIISK